MEDRVLNSYLDEIGREQLSFSLTLLSALREQKATGMKGGIYQTREKIKTDDWFFPLYNSPMNPISAYTRRYKENLEHKAFVNSNKLP